MTSVEGVYLDVPILVVCVVIIEFVPDDFVSTSVTDICQKIEYIKWIQSIRQSINQSINQSYGEKASSFLACILFYILFVEK